MFAYGHHRHFQTTLLQQFLFASLVMQSFAKTAVLPQPKPSLCNEPGGFCSTCNMWKTTHDLAQSVACCCISLLSTCKYFVVGNVRIFCNFVQILTKSCHDIPAAYKNPSTQPHLVKATFKIPCRSRRIMYKPSPGSIRCLFIIMYLISKNKCSMQRSTVARPNTSAIITHAQTPK